MSTTQKLVDYIKWLYLQYRLGTMMYIMEPFEVRIFNSIVLCLICILIYHILPLSYILAVFYQLSSLGFSSRNETLLVYQKSQLRRYPVGNFNVNY